MKKSERSLSHKFVTKMMINPPKATEIAQNVKNAPMTEKVNHRPNYFFLSLQSQYNLLPKQGER